MNHRCHTTCFFSTLVNHYELISSACDQLSANDGTGHAIIVDGTSNAANIAHECEALFKVRALKICAIADYRNICKQCNNIKRIHGIPFLLLNHDSLSPHLSLTQKYFAFFEFT